MKKWMKEQKLVILNEITRLQEIILYKKQWNENIRNEMKRVWNDTTWNEKKWVWYEKKWVWHDMICRWDDSASQSTFPRQSSACTYTYTLYVQCSTELTVQYRTERSTNTDTSIIDIITCWGFQDEEKRYLTERWKMKRRKIWKKVMRRK